MITAIRIGAYALVILGLTTFLPVVEELPFGLDEPMLQIFSNLNYIADIVPMIGVVWDRVLIMFGVMLLLFLWHWVLTIFHLIKS